MTACLSAAGGACRNATDPAELSRLARGVDSLASALRTAPDTQTLWLRQYMQAMVDRTAVLEECGRVATAPDLRTAASLGLDAAVLGLPTVERAYRWARRAVLADTSERHSWRLMATAWDHMQVLRKQPQWFATMISCGTTSDARCVLPLTDTTKVSDPQRVELGLNTLAQQRAAVDSMNRFRGRP